MTSGQILNPPLSIICHGTTTAYVSTSVASYYWFYTGNIVSASGTSGKWKTRANNSPNSFRGLGQCYCLLECLSSVWVGGHAETERDRRKDGGLQILLCHASLFVQSRWALAEYVILNHSAKHTVFRNENDTQTSNLVIVLLYQNKEKAAQNYMKSFVVHI